MAFLFLVSMAITYILFPRVIKMVAGVGFVRPNYRNENIPVAVGFIFVFSSLLTILFMNPIFNFNRFWMMTFLFSVFAMSFLGIIDDFWGSRQASGLKGHFKKLLLEGELTTGGLKAIAGGVVALVISYNSRDLTTWQDAAIILVNALVIAFSTNSINLLDLRPGRAVKGFLLGAVILIILGWGNPRLNFLLIMAGAAVAYLPYDLNARVMMGDTGSNVLGVTLGLTSVWVLNFQARLILLALLLFFHIITEKYSLTAIIEKNFFLRFLDMLGRKQG